MTTRTPQAKTTDTAKIIRRELVAYRRLRDDMGHADDIMAAAQPALVTVAEPATDYKE